MNTLLHKQRALLSNDKANMAYANAYYRLYTNISLDWDREREPQRTILFTTPMSYPGQAIAVANVAIAAAQNGTPTVLIDADVHAPKLHQLFGITTPTGLYELLVSQNSAAQNIEAALRKTHTTDLYLLCAGEKQPALPEVQRLFTTRLAATLGNIRTWLQGQGSQTGLIIINGPPVLAEAETSLLGARADQTFLVIAAGRTTRSQARQAQEYLERAHARLTGTVLLDI